jgi:diguanylate cyclase (GGDEF)-like protein
VDSPEDDIETEQPRSPGMEIWLVRGVGVTLALAVFALSVVAWETGSTGWFRLYAAAFFVMIGATVFVAQIPRRIQRKRDAEWASRFHEMAIRDELTGLYNRRHFNRTLERAMRDGSRGVAVAIVDLDGFKHINDTLGHAAGDLALRITAAALKGAAPGAVVARMGGDEFALIFERIAAASHVELERQLSEAIAAAPFIVEEGSGVVLSGSVGVVRLKPGMDAETLLREADRALYEAKQRRASVHDRRRAG